MPSLGADVEAVAAGVAMGVLHFFLFLRGTRFVLDGGGAAAGGLLVVAMLLRHLLLGVLFLGAWKVLGVRFVPMGAGVMAAWAVLRLVLVWRAR